MKKIIACLVGAACMVMAAPSFSVEKTIGGFKIDERDGIVGKQINGIKFAGKFINDHFWMLANRSGIKDQMYVLVSFAKGKYLPTDNRVKSIVSLVKYDCDYWRVKQLRYIEYSDYFIKGSVLTEVPEKDWEYPTDASMYSVILRLGCKRF